MKEQFLITGTGKTGYATTIQLLNEGYLVKILVRLRNPKALELEKPGAEIAIGEFNNYGQIKPAFFSGKQELCYGGGFLSLSPLVQA